MDREGTAKTVGFDENRAVQSVTEGKGQPFGRQDTSHHAVGLNRSAQLFYRFRNVLQRQQRHAVETPVLGEKLLGEKIIVGAAQLDCVARVADLADVHEASWIENRKFDVALVELICPFAPVRHAKILITKVIGGN